MPTAQQRLRASVITKHGNTCAYCGEGPLHKRALHLDLIVPAQLGGQSTLKNLRPACIRCATQKADRPLLEYVEARLVALSREQTILEAIRAARTRASLRKELASDPLEPPRK